MKHEPYLCPISRSGCSCILPTCPLPTLVFFILITNKLIQLVQTIHVLCRPLTRTQESSMVTSVKNNDCAPPGSYQLPISVRMGPEDHLPHLGRIWADSVQLCAGSPSFCDCLSAAATSCPETSLSQGSSSFSYSAARSLSPYRVWQVRQMSHLGQDINLQGRRFLLAQPLTGFSASSLDPIRLGLYQRIMAEGMKGNG